MQHWSQLGTRNWRVKPGRTAGAIGAIALGVGVVIWVTCAYESVRLALRDQVWFWVGRSHLSVESNSAEGTVYEQISEDIRQKMTNVEAVTYQLKFRMTLEKVPDEDKAKAALFPDAIEVQAVGIKPELETRFRDFQQERLVGRLFRPDEMDGAVIDAELADNFGLDLGDRFTLRAMQTNPHNPPTEKIAAFTVVGRIEHRRIAKQQRPMVLAPLERIQALAGYDREPRYVTKIDLMLKDTSAAGMAEAKRELSRIVGRHKRDFVVKDAERKLNQVKNAERQTQFVLLLLSTVALFTAFFIILSTLSMGMVERIGQLGTLRCLGATRFQLASLVLGEAIVLGIIGMALGIPVGLGLGKLTVLMAPEYVGFFAINRTGLILALVGGGLTTLAGASLPMLQALRVSPLEASRPQAHPTPGILAWIALVIGVGMIGGHLWMLDHLNAKELYKQQNSLLAVALLYAGYALVVPAIVRLVGLVVVRVAAVVLRIRYSLLADQIGRAVWRSSAICRGLMVGLSLIVTLAVHSESLAAGWDFPKDFCEAYVFIGPAADRDLADKARQLPGVAESCLANTNINCLTNTKGLFPFPSRFIAGDPEEFFNIARVEFVEGSKEEAIAKLKRGRGVLVTPEFVRSNKLGYGDKIWVGPSTLFIGRYGGLFEIVGVVTSPALNMAANYFNASDILTSASVYVLLGSFQDAEKYLRVKPQTSLFLLNFDLPEIEMPAEFLSDEPPKVLKMMPLFNLVTSWTGYLPERQTELATLKKEMDDAHNLGETIYWRQVPILKLFQDTLREDVLPQWDKQTPTQRWRSFREALVLKLIGWRSGASWDMHGSIRGLKDQIDRDLRRATQLFAAIPMVALIVAALGVGNLMMANVASRSRQLATLRAVGAMRWQITRLVIGEAIVLGTLGSAIGVALGIQAARSINIMVEGLWGFRPVWTMPMGWMATAVGFTMGVCLIAGLLPARRAARANIIEALQTT